MVWKKLIVTVAILALFLVLILPKPARTPIEERSIVTRQDGARISYYTSGQQPPPCLVPVQPRSLGQ